MTLLATDPEVTDVYGSNGRATAASRRIAVNSRPRACASCIADTRRGQIDHIAGV
jgi:hypothetical protein